MKFKDILPNTIYKYVGNTKRTAFYFRTGDEVTAVPSPRAAHDAPSNHLLAYVDRASLNSDEANRWDPAEGEAARYVDQVEVLRWVDNESGRGLVHPDQNVDLTFQPTPIQQHEQKLSEYTNFDTEESWAEGEREALVAERGTEYYWDLYNKHYPHIISLTDHTGTIPLVSIEGPYDEVDFAAEALVKRAERDAREVIRVEASKVRRAAETKAKAFLVTTLANVPDALVDQTSNGLDRAVERAQQFGISDWSLDYVSYRDEPNTETPDGNTLVGLTASALAAITYAWQQTFGDASWEDISAGVYERFHSGDEVKHITVDVPATEDVEVTAERVERFLPGNYEVVGHETYRTRSVVFVKGTDVAGWTAVDYVIPRLASGLLTATVDSLSRKAVSA